MDPNKQWEAFTELLLYQRFYLHWLLPVALLSLGIWCILVKLLFSETACYMYCLCMHKLSSSCTSELHLMVLKSFTRLFINVLLYMCINGPIRKRYYFYSGIDQFVQ